MKNGRQQKYLDKALLAVFARKKQCMYCNSQVRQNLRVRCSSNFEFGRYDVVKCIFEFFKRKEDNTACQLHVFSFGNVLLHITSISNALELINNIQIMYIASAKIPEREGSISQFSFYRQPPDYQSHVFSLAYPVDEFSLNVGLVRDYILLCL